MIDFSCCEVEKAVKTLFADNEVLGIDPIIKSYSQPFQNDLRTVYYGRFTNPAASNNLAYAGTPLINNDWTLFTSVENPEYDFFQGYAIRLKNALPVPVVDFGDTNLIDAAMLENPASALYINWVLDTGNYPLVKFSFQNGDYFIMKSSADGTQAGYLNYPSPIYVGDYVGQSVRFQCLNDDLSPRRFAYTKQDGEPYQSGMPFIEGVLHFDTEIVAGNRFMTPNLQGKYA
ncbi:hypothetical protein [Flagellimonas sp.]|uniref:hypothetical protein n=1 Tax=Flagellimonas sp. TaxID=2058762 RepID=UPI003C7993D9